MATHGAFDASCLRRYNSHIKLSFKSSSTKSMHCYGPCTVLTSRYYSSAAVTLSSSTSSSTGIVTMITANRLSCDSQITELKDCGLVVLSAGLSVFGSSLARAF